MGNGWDIIINKQIKLIAEDSDGLAENNQMETKVALGFLKRENTLTKNMFEEDSVWQ